MMLLLHLTSDAEMYFPSISSTNSVRCSIMADSIHMHGWLLLVMKRSAHQDGLRGVVLWAERLVCVETGVSDSSSVSSVSLWASSASSLPVPQRTFDLTRRLHSYSNPPACAADVPLTSQTLVTQRTSLDYLTLVLGHLHLQPSLLLLQSDSRASSHAFTAVPSSQKDLNTRPVC